MVDVNKITPRNDVALKQRLMEEREDAIRNYAAAMSQAKEEGLAEGEAKGREEGEKIGERKKAIETARNFFKMGLSVEQVAQGTGLSIAEVEALTI